MPFTFSHPAIVFPVTFLPKKYYSLTGLIMGSMIPDFEYFLRMGVNGMYGHSLPGILWFDLPLALLMTILFHHLVRNPLIDNLPRIFYARFWQFRAFNWMAYLKANWLVVSISIIFGTGTHIFWDGFTHPNGYFAKLIPALENQVSFFGVILPMYDFMQYLSSVVGGAFIAIVVFRMPVDGQVPQMSTKSYWIIAGALALAIFMLRLSVGVHFEYYATLVVSAISSGLLALVVTSLLTGRKVSVYSEN